MSINRVVISGNLTRDPELRRTQSGMAILTFGVAVNDRRRNPQSGEWEDYANFVDCTMFGNRAESLSNILSKGMKVAIEGKLRYSSWERDGQKRSKLEVIVDEIDFMSSRNGQGGSGYQGGSNYQGGNAGYQGGNGGYQNNNAGAYQPAAAPAIDTTSSVYDDDIPF
jgi:single-strand DNA-binding protein